ncbi:hypothetical protein BUALT_Bualt08G0102000 [Buddleja alternifolia]|uniref:SAP domain-containing protein n=1 Tax=Buddleja alternifolia TaxID=168488 RepID=A0AAV6XCB3_9LAMI|nr:hypothetical protein BUALT_Bualt08G0102000 [Buddleja alternifolia]
MDFHGMKRKDLQALCKKHKIPANLSNLEMANRLTQFIKENEKSVTRGRKKAQDETASETESTNVVVNREVKKVRFSPEHELIEFTRSVQIKRRSRRKSISSGNSTLSVENVDSGEMSNEIVGSPCGVTRSRRLKLMEVSVNEKKRGGKGVKRSIQNDNVAATESFNNGELRKTGVDSPGRVMQLRRKTIVKAVVNASKRGIKRAKHDDKRDEKALGNVDGDKLIEEVVDSPVRLRRSRNQRLTEASTKETREGKVEKNNDIVALASSVNDDDGVVAWRSTRNRRVANEGKSVKNNENGFDDKNIEEAHVMVEPQVLLRRSKRNVNGVADSEMLNDDTGKHENRATKSFRKIPKPLTVEGSRVDEESSGSKIDPDPKLEVVLQHEEPIKLEPRRSNRRKSMMPNTELKTENEDRCMLGNSVPQLEAAGGVCKDEEKVRQPAGVMRRSRRKTSVLKQVSTGEKLDAVAVVENLETSKHISKPCPVDSIIQHKNEAKKQKRSPISGSDVINDPNSPIQSIKESSRSKKATPADVIGNLSAKRTPPSRFKERHSLDASSREGLLEVGESLCRDAQLAVSETTSNPVSSSNSSAKNIICDVGLTSSRKSLTKKKGISIADADKNEPDPIVFSQTEDSSCHNKIVTRALPECSNVPENAGLAETSSLDESVLLSDQIDSEADMDLTEDEGDRHIQPSLDAVDSVGKMEGVFVQENLDSVEPGHANEISLSNACDHKSEISKNNDEDAVPKGGEAGAFESCDLHIRPTDSENELQLKESSSSKLRTSLEGDNTAEGDRGINSELAETDEDGCLKDHKNSEEDSEFNLSYLFDGEKSARIIPQHRGIFSGECSVVDSDEQGMSKNSLAVSPITICSKRTEIKLKTGLEAHHIAKREETQIDNSIQPEAAETDEGGSPKDQKSKCDEDDDFSVYNLFDEDRVISSDENVMDSDEQGIFHNSTIVAPITMCKSSEIMLMRDHESNQIVEEEETNVHQNIDSGSAESDVGGCLKNQKSSNDEDWEFDVSNLFDSGKSPRITPRDRGMFTAGYSIKSSDEQGMFHDSQAVSTMCVNSTEVNLGAVSSNLQERVPSEPNSVSNSQGSVATIFDTCDITESEDMVQEKEAANFQSKIPGDEMSMEKIVGDEHTNKDTYEPAEQPKSPLSTPTAIAKTIGGQETWSVGTKTAGNAMSILKTNGKGKTSEMVEGSNNLEDAIDANSGKDKEDFDDAQISDVAISMDYSKVGVESNSNDLLETNIVSDAEIELHNLFGTTEDNVIHTEINENSSQGTEIANPTMFMNKSIANSGDSFTKKQKKEMEGERGSECEKTINNDVVLPTNRKEVSDTGSNVGGEENELKLLFATPIKIVAPCKDDETSAGDRTLKNDVFYRKCVSTIKENATTPIKSDEKMGDTSNELQNSLSLGNSLSHNGEDIANDELSKVHSVEVMNPCTTTVTPESEYDGCEASEDQWTENTFESAKEIYSSREESKDKKNIYSEASDEATYDGNESMEKNFINSAGSLRSLDNVGGCHDMLIDTDLLGKLSCGSEGKMAKSTDAGLGISEDADFQKSNSHIFTACYEDVNILREAPIDTSAGPVDPVIANIGSIGIQKDDAIDKGTPSSTFSKASHCDDEVTERKYEKTIIKDDDSYDAKADDFSHEILDEMQINSELTVLKIRSLCHTQSDNFQSNIELHSTPKESNEIGSTTQNFDYVVPPAEHGTSICGANSNTLSRMAMNVLLGDNGGGDIEKSEAEISFFNFDGDNHEKNDKEAEENIVSPLLSMTELQLEEKIVNFNNKVSTVSDEPAAGFNEILKESDVEDTIKEYIDSESSMSADFDESDVFTHIEERTFSEDAALGESQEDIDGILSNSKGKNDESSFDTESKELEAMLFVEPAQGSMKAVKSPVCVDSVGDEGSSADADEKASVVDTEGKELEEAKKNSRTILIHGTPRKLLTVADMKENAPRNKSSHIGDFTTMRPAKRRALQDVHWK